ncbi:MAG TPA: peptidylprolyl isomerase [Pseudomonadales bacterium]|nr:peptidylprolyl isomerase [Pseudomonadales bacterium]
MSEQAVSAQTRATFFFSLSLTDGQVVDSCFGKQPAQCVPGDGNLLPAFDACLLGLTVGDKKQFTIAAEDAFGVRRDDNLKRVPRNRFAKDIELTEGLVLSFGAAEGGELPGIVHRLMGDMVEIDFNHPLAGRDIVFDVEIVGVEIVGAENAN